LVFSGGEGNDQYILSTSGGGTTLYISETLSNQPPVNYAVLIAALTADALTFNTSGGDDTFTLDALGGNPIPAAGITLDAGSQDVGGDSLIVRGSAAAD